MRCAGPARSGTSGCWCRVAVAVMRWRWRGSLFDPPEEMRGEFDVVLEHTCMSGLPPSMRADYRRGIDLTLRRGGLLIGVWFIEPDLDPGEEGPPYLFSVAELTALFAEGYEILDDYVPDVAFPGREGRERVRVLRRVVGD